MWNRKKKEPEVPLNFEEEVFLKLKTMTFEEEVLLKLKTIDTRTKKIEKEVGGFYCFIWGIIIFSVIGAVAGEFLARYGF